jgi:hypothetical protein
MSIKIGAMIMTVFHDTFQLSDFQTQVEDDVMTSEDGERPLIFHLKSLFDRVTVVSRKKLTRLEKEALDSQESIDNFSAEVLRNLDNLERLVRKKVNFRRCSTARIAIAQKNWSAHVKQFVKKVTTGQKSKIICRTCNKNCF